VISLYILPTKSIKELDQVVKYAKRMTVGIANMMQAVYARQHLAQYMGGAVIDVTSPCSISMLNVTDAFEGDSVGG
jgi:hypothetical protein